MKRTRRSTLLTGFTAAAGAAALGRTARAQTALTPLRVGTTPNDDGAPLLYGQKAGIFAKHGLDLQITKLPGGPATAGLLGGSFDLGKGNISSWLEAHAKSLPITLIAAASVHNPRSPFAAFLVRKDSPIATGRDFNNQLVGVIQISDIGNVALLKWMGENGGDGSSVRFVEVPGPAAGAAVEQGRVVAAESGQPSIFAALESGRLRMMNQMHDSLGVGYVITAWATTEAFSAKNPGVIRAFVRAWSEAATYTNAHHSETVDLIAEFTSVPAAVVAKMPRATAGTALRAAMVQPVIDATAKFGDLKRGFPAGELIDPNIR
jgi:NitT/TauT family transport system substrate-binding protein